MYCAGQPPRTFASMREALAAAEAGLAFVARTALPEVPAQELADGLRVLERAESAQVAARSGVLSAFVAQAGPEADGHISARAGWRGRPASPAAPRPGRWAGCGGCPRTARSPAHWPAARSPPPGPGTYVTGPTGCLRTGATTRTRSCWPRRRAARTSPTCPGWPRKCSAGPRHLTPTPTTARDSPAGQSAWTCTTAVRGSWPGT
jgi:hypothetical protein